MIREPHKDPLFWVIIVAGAVGISYFVTFRTSFDENVKNGLTIVGGLGSALVYRVIRAILWT